MEGSIDAQLRRAVDGQEDGALYFNAPRFLSRGPWILLILLLLSHHYQITVFLVIITKSWFL